jgi:cytoskeleton protein RodZ
VASFGENLRKERELRGISLREIAEATKIGVRFLEALEKDRLDLLPGGLFPRAFVRQYARHLGLDAERVVAEFVYSHGEPAPPPQQQQRRPLPLGPIFLGALALVAAGLSLRRPAPQPEAAAPPRASAVRPSDRVFPPPPEVPTPAPVGDALVLTLTAEQSCWVQARADGETVLDRVLAKGETETLEAEGEFVLSVGNAGGLAFSVNDRPGLRLGRSGEVRRNIVITRQSLPSLVEDTPSMRAAHSS